VHFFSLAICSTRATRSRFFWEILTLKPRRNAAIVIWSEMVEFLDLASQEATAKRAIGHECNAQFASCGKNLIFGIARPKRIFGL
jgi:hypothetical protein